MKALTFRDSLKLVGDAPVPRRSGEALVRVIYAGICNTDLEIVKGYAGFHGTLGHEFVGRVAESPDLSLVGHRVVGEINAGCGHCELCLDGDPRHCAARTVLGIMVTGPEATAPARYVVALALVVVFGVIAKNLVRGRIGRSWMAIRDRDIAAEIIGVRPLRTKLLAFAISSFYCGVAGSMLVFLFLGSAETLAFDINQSFLVLFMVIIGGLGSILGSFLGAAFITLVPIFLTNAPHWLGLDVSVALQKQVELMIFGGLILFFLIVEPHGLARLWQIGKEKLRMWPFPH